MPNKIFISLVIFLQLVGCSPVLDAQQIPGPVQRIQAQPSPVPSPAQPVPGSPVPSPVPQAPLPRPVPAPPQPAAAAGAPAEAAPSPGGAPAPATPQRRLLPSPSLANGGMVSLNFNRADLIEIIHIIAQHLKLTYTIDPDVKGTVTINSAAPLKPDDLLPVFHQVLRMNGAVAVRTGNLYHIMPIKDGKGLARPVGQSKEDSFALQVVPVRFFTVGEMKKVLTPFLQPGGEIVDNPRGNFLIIMDLPSNIQRLVEIAELIDVQVFAGMRMEIYPPKVASAEELAQEMTKIMQSFSASTPQAETFAAQFIAIPRINQLLVISHSEAAWTYARRWLERIDVVAEGPGRRIFIYPVENGKATELADVLNQAFGQPSTGGRTPSSTLQTLHRSTPGAGGTGTQPSTGQKPFGTTGTQNPSINAAIAVPGQPAAPVAPPPTPGVPRPAAPQGPGARPEEQLRIVADPATNSLIIYGTAQEFQNVKNVLKELDAIPRQVLLDVLVAEITLSDNQSLGVDYEVLRRNPGSIFGQRFGSAGALRTLGELFPPGDAFGGGLSGVVGGKDIRAFINAIQSDSRFKVLSSPSILATDNKPARIQVGTEEPIATGTTTTQVGTAASSTSIQYRNTGRIVTIIPQVNSQGLVNLQILAEVSQKRSEPVKVGSDSFPAFDTRQAETTAVVHDGETLAIGGIITDSKSRTRSGVPYLMDLPVIGRFFSTTSDEIDRTELIMLITPKVIRNRDEARSVTEDFKSVLLTLRNELEKMRRDREKDLEKRKSQMREQPKPAAPLPLSAPPAVNAPARPGAQFAPEVSPVAPAPLLVDRAVGKEDAPQVAEIQTAPETALAVAEGVGELAMSEQAAAAVEAPVEEKAVDTPQKEHGQKDRAISSSSKAARVWVVQVAAFAQTKEADLLAEALRGKGYDAHVFAAEVGGKTWHRVQVGELDNRQDALDLQKSLKSKEKLEQAFIASR